MNYSGVSDDFVGLADLGAVSVAAAARRCTNAQNAYTKRLATFQKQLSKAKTQAAATRIQTNMQKVMTNLATRAQTACAAPVPPVTGCPPGSTLYLGQCTPIQNQIGTIGTSFPPSYPGTYVGQIVPAVSDTAQPFNWVWTGASWTTQSQQPNVAVAPPTYPGSYVGQVVGYYTWNGYAWSQSSGAAPLNMPPWLQPGGGFGPTPGSNFYPQPYYSGGGPLLTPINEADQYTGATYASPGYAPQPTYAAAPYGPELTPIDPADVSMDMPGYDTQAEDLQPNSQAPGFPPSGMGPTQTSTPCSMEPATSDQYGPLQQIQIVCNAPAAASQSPTYNGQTITSVEESEIGMMGLGRYLG